ncbi:MAG: vWA domain-containing protein, partial [Chloroflexota bacterium]
ARTSDVPRVCDPGPGAAWTVEGDIAYATCTPTLGHVCNTIVVSGPASVDYNFAPVLGVFEGSTGARSAAACKGACGEPPEVPVDLVMILDRTGSMNGVDTDNARNAADSVRKVYDPRLQWISLGLLHRSKTESGCVTIADNSDGWSAVPSVGLREWVPIGLTGVGASFGSDYVSDSSPMANAIACFNNSSGQGTDLADPVRMATYELETYGRADAVKAILLLSDGKPNNSATPAVNTTRNYCADAFDAAQAAKAKGIEIYTVGFGLDVERDHICQDTFGDWKNRSAPDLLAAMATDSANDNGCPGTENDDGDRYYCVPKTSGASTDLSDVFETAVAQLTGHSRLVNVE